MTRRTRTPAIRVRCPACGDRTLSVDDLGFTHEAGTVTGWYWRCAPCGELRSAAAEPALLALLHDVGVRETTAQSRDAPPGDLDHRTIVSLRILLEDPALLTTLAAAPRRRTPITRTPITPTPPT
jgi:hypothetical protein